MAIATQITPQSVNLRSEYSLALSQANPIEQKFVPKNPDGTVFDCTDLTACVMKAQLQGPNPSLAINCNGTMTTHDATGFTWSMTGAQALGLYANGGGYTNFKYTLQITDSTTYLIAGIGNLVIGINP